MIGTAAEMAGDLQWSLDLDPKSFETAMTRLAETLCSCFDIRFATPLRYGTGCTILQWPVGGFTALSGSLVELQKSDQNSSRNRLPAYHHYIGPMSREYSRAAALSLKMFSRFLMRDSI
jgi:hypothetical protein